MIRFVNLREYYWFDENETSCLGPFAFIDTINEKFIEINGSQIWFDMEDLNSDLASLRPKSSQFIDDFIDRITRLVPEEIKNEKKKKSIEIHEK